MNKILIFRDSDNKLKVTPDYVHLKRSGTLEVYAINVDATIDSSILGIVEVEAGQMARLSLVNADTSADSYPYTVRSGNDAVVGNSPPAIVVGDDPPDG